MKRVRRWRTCWGALTAVLALAGGAAPLAPATAGRDPAPAVEERQRRIDLAVWSSKSRLAMTPAGEMLTAMALGNWPPHLPDLGPAPSAAPTSSQQAGENVRVNDVSHDYRSACTTQSEASVRAFGDVLVAGFNDSSHGCVLLDSYTGSAYSTDGGATWADGGAIRPPEGGFSGGDPSVAVDRQGRFYFASLERAPGANPTPVGTAVIAGRSCLGVRVSDDGGETWSAPADGTNGLVGSHDKELIEVDTSGGPYDGNVYLVWTDFAGGQRRGVIRFSRSTDRGATWSDPIKLSINDGDYNTGAYPAIGPNGEVYVLWQTQLTNTPRIYFTASYDGGKTFTIPRRILTIRAPGQQGACGRWVMNGDIRMLGWPVVAVDHTPIVDPANPPPHRGTIYVAYASGEGADRGNIYVARSTDGGATWALSSGVAVNDDDTTLDQFMPAIAAKPGGEIAVMWYDRRADPQNIDIEVYVARSTDGGATWGPNLKVSDVPFEGVGNTTQRDPGVAGCYMGDYNQVIPHGDGYGAVWGDNRDRYPAVAESRSDPNVYFGTFSFYEESHGEEARPRGTRSGRDGGGAIGAGRGSSGPSVPRHLG